MKATHSKKQKTGVMAGYTGFSAGRINQRYVYIPIDKMCDPVSSSVCFSSSLLSLYTHVRALCQARKRASTQARKRARARSLSFTCTRACASVRVLSLILLYISLICTNSRTGKEGHGVHQVTRVQPDADSHWPTRCVLCHNEPYICMMM